MDTKERTPRRRPPSGQMPAKRRTPARDVVYTQPAPFNKQRFFLRLLTVVAVVLALLFGMSIFFKVDQKETSIAFKMQRGEELLPGVHNYTEQEILEASGIQDGETLLTLRKSEISGRIMEKLPYVVQVRVGIKLPDTVNIEIVETDVVYAMEADDGSWWLIRSDGKVVEKTNAADAKQTTVISGVKLDNPKTGAQAAAKQPEVEETEGEQQPVTVLASEQLDAVLQIMRNLEKNGVIGGVASIDVTRLNNIELWYGNRYQVSLGDAARLDYKISAMKAAVDKMKTTNRGMLDVSFTIKEKEVVFTPFE